VKRKAQLTILILAIGLLSFSCTRRPPPQASPVPAPAPPSAPAPSSGPAAASPQLDLSADPARIKPGESTTLIWESRNADQVVVDHQIGPVEMAGRIRIFPDETTTYEVTAVGPGGDTRKTVTVEVVAEPGRIVEEELAARPLEERFSYFVKPVFFEYDSSTLSEQAKLTLDENIRWLMRPENAGVRIVLQGHTDERGTDEYNLALGDKRAQVVKRYMSQQGLTPDRVSTVSLGEESPFDHSETEEAYALNRRVQFVLDPGPPQP